MFNLTVFENEKFGKVRTLEIDNEPWFVGKDVADALGYSNTKDALKRHVDEEDKEQNDGVAIYDPMGRKQNPTVINESGLYSLILSSKLPSAKEFKRWVTSEVLPSIRKHGNDEDKLMHQISVLGQNRHLDLEDRKQTVLPQYQNGTLSTHVETEDKNTVVIPDGNRR